LCTHRAHCVRTGELAIAEKFNEYTRTLEPGQHFLIDICGCYEEKLVARMSMRLQSIRLRNERCASASQPATPSPLRALT